jgi:hypothetical protein
MLRCGSHPSLVLPGSSKTGSRVLHPSIFSPLTTWILAGEKPREFACPFKAGGGGSASGQSPRPPGMAVWGN